MRTLYFRPVVSSFFPRLISAVADWLSTILLQMVWLVLVQIYNAGLKCAARDSLEIQDAKMTQNITICTASHSHKLSGCIFATKTRIDNRKKCVKQQCLRHTSSQYGEHRPTSRWDLLVNLGHPCKVQWVLRFGSVLHGALVVGVIQTLRRCTEDASNIRQGVHHVGHWPTFLVLTEVNWWRNCSY